MGLAALVAGAAVGAAPANAATGTAVEVMRLRFGDKLRRAAKMLDELQQDIANDVRERIRENTERRKGSRRHDAAANFFRSLSACAVVPSVFWGPWVCNTMFHAARQ